ncbi:MAG: hypothetical protein ACXAD7_11615 [Candidatus Kariarchaeaceae archaeon]|jgi:DNA-binding MarR family transcriptional regulator
MGEKPTGDEVLHHVTTLKAFIYMRSNDGSDVGIRDTQRILGVKSPSTVSWHFEKLEEAGFIEKLPSNRYKLTEKGRKFDNIRIPMMVSAQFIGRNLIPNFTILISFLGFSCLFTFLLWVFSRDLYVIGLGASLSLLLSFVLLLREWLHFKKEYDLHYKMKRNKPN